MINKINSKNYFDVLQVFRGIAAVMVVLCHLVLAFKHFHNWDNSILIFIGNFGALGVDFFFVLSGFIISYSTFQKKYHFKDYLINRFLRIYIPYLPIGIAMFLLYFLFPNISESGRDVNLIRSITLFPIGNPALSVSWTLSYEMMFYLLFGLCFISRKIWNIFIILWTSAIIIFNYFSGLNTKNLIFLNPYCLEFILGYLICLTYFYRENIKNILSYPILSYPILWLCAILFFCLTVIIKFYNLNLFYFSSNLMFAISASFLILAAINRASQRHKVSKNKILLLLGNASFSIYLVHDPIISLSIRLLHSNNFYLAVLLFIVFLIICCLGGVFYYFIFEKFILGRARKIIAQKNCTIVEK